jgi:SAM-dependent methyltransferase
MVKSDLPDRCGFGPHRFNVVRCEACGLVRTDPRPNRESIGAYYPPEYAPFRTDETTNSAVHRRLGRRLRDLPYRLRHGAPWAAESPPPGAGSMLDIGAGAGVALAQHRRAGWEVWGIEPSPDMARVAARRAGIAEDRIRCVPAEEAIFPDASFDFVLLIHVIEHLHDPRAVLDRVRHWLRPGGHVLIRCPNFASLERRIFGRRWFPLDVPRHINHFDPVTLAALLETAGLSIETIRPERAYDTLPLSLGAMLGIFDWQRGFAAGFTALRYALMPASSLLYAFDMPVMEVIAAAAPE